MAQPGDIARPPYWERKWYKFLMVVCVPNAHTTYRVSCSDVAAAIDWARQPDTFGHSPGQRHYAAVVRQMIGDVRE